MVGFCYGTSPFIVDNLQAAAAGAAVAWNTKKHITSIHPLRYLTERLTMRLSLSSVGVKTSQGSDWI